MTSLVILENGFVGLLAILSEMKFAKMLGGSAFFTPDLQTCFFGVVQVSKEMLEPITIEAIKECVGKLESRSKAVVRGRYHDGLAAPQLARQLETTAVNIRQMLVRIRRQIKQCVEYRILEKA